MAGVQLGPGFRTRAAAWAKTRAPSSCRAQDCPDQTQNHSPRHAAQPDPRGHAWPTAWPPRGRKRVRPLIGSPNDQARALLAGPSVLSDENLRGGRAGAVPMHRCRHVGRPHRAGDTWSAGAPAPGVATFPGRRPAEGPAYADQDPCGAEQDRPGNKTNVLALDHRVRVFPNRAHPGRGLKAVVALTDAHLTQRTDGPGDIVEGGTVTIRPADAS